MYGSTKEEKNMWSLVVLMVASTNFAITFNPVAVTNFASKELCEMGGVRITMMVKAAAHQTNLTAEYSCIQTKGKIDEKPLDLPVEVENKQSEIPSKTTGEKINEKPLDLPVEVEYNSTKQSEIIPQQPEEIQ